MCGPDNCTSACELLHRVADCWSKPLLLNPRLFGNAQSRDRLFIPSIPRDKLVSRGLTDRAASDKMESLMVRFSGSCQNTVEAYMVDDSEVLKAKADLKFMKDSVQVQSNADLARVRTQVTSNGVKWPGVHKTIFKKKGKAWSAVQPPTDTTYQDYPLLKELTPRELDILALHGVDEYREHTSRFIEVGRVIGRSHVSEGFVHAITPNTRRYCTRRCRLLSGAECMRLMSLFFPAHKVRKFSDRLLHSLAGNAFDAGCYGAALMATIVTLSHDCRSKLIQDPQPPPPQLTFSDTETDDDDENVLEDLFAA